MERPIIDGIAIRCRNLTKSLAFYEDLLGFERQWESDGMVGLKAPLATGDFNVMLDQVTRDTEAVPGEVGVVIGISVPDVKAVAKHLADAGHGMRIQPTDGPTGQPSAEVFDPDGHEVWLSSSA